MIDATLSPGAFQIGAVKAPLRDELMALEERQTRELIVNGVRGWWVRRGGWTEEFAFMAPSERTANLISFRSEEDHGSEVRVERPNDAFDADEFFKLSPPYALAGKEGVEEARRRLLALARMGWLSTSKWYGDRGELYDR